jgi:hypothetical protein
MSELPRNIDGASDGGLPPRICSASFGERLTAAIALRQTEIGPEAKRIQGILGMADCPERRQWIKEAVNQLTAGLGLCFLADMTMEEMLEPWVAAMERQNPELKDKGLATQPAPQMPE